MQTDISILIGGQAGQGIQTVGELLARMCQQAGLSVFAVNDFESRIRGGHSFFQLRISERRIQAPSRHIHLLVAMSGETHALHRQKLVEGGICLIDSAEDGAGEGAVAVPVTQLATEAGGKIMANTVAAGACLGLLGAPFEQFQAIITDRFSGADANVRENNLDAARAGYRAVASINFQWKPVWRDMSSEGMLMNGARALALGALAADCRIGAFYPMSPATGIMQQLSELSDTYPLVVEQAEDEIAAINMTIGAAFAGVRAMTATSGGGFCLMTEGLGLAAITETPVVIVNAQRPGPATGLPTRTAQGDLLFVINAAQDEFPRFVFAPTGMDDAYAVMIRAFDLSEKYQVPAIVMTDQYFNDSFALTDGPFDAPHGHDRYTVSDADMADPSAYKRYAFTGNGISPRALPCNGQALVCAAGNEHRQDGHISEDREDRNAMVEKRSAKLSAMQSEMRPPAAYHVDGSRTLLVSWGSTAGAVQEAVSRLRDAGEDAGCLVMADIWPFPAAAFQEVARGADTLITVEQNATAQLGRLIRQETGMPVAHSILQYDGRAFCVEDIVDQYHQLN
ncbi:MAG: 2-oxoacid:acceptor oxidoreductase subunit alpha [Thermodesulfobacteriota bacterium]|nr:2-oxoacid:acceptor oxidoreductase subunit alpha [Thermodesulfobacteriota bacterium]